MSDIVSSKVYVCKTEYNDTNVIKALSSASTVKENLNGGQIQTLLNGFLYRAVKKVVLNSRMLDNFVAYMLSYIARLRKKKLTYVERNDAIDRLALYLLISNPELKFSLFKSISLERFYIFKYLSTVSKQLTEYSKIWIDYINLRYVDSGVKGKAVTSLKATLASQLTDIRNKHGINTSEIVLLSKGVSSCLNSYSEYRQKVISHYYKLCYKKAKSYFKDKPNLGYDIEEIYQDYLIAVAKAIDKYRAGRGAVTSYINWWILNVSTCDYSSHEYGIAYTVPASHRRDIANHRVMDTNFSVSIDTPVKTSSNDDGVITLKDKLVSEDSDHAETLAENAVAIRFRRLVKLVDPLGVARMTLGIDEEFTEEEKAKMQRYKRYCAKKFLNEQKA